MSLWKKLKVILFGPISFHLLDNELLVCFGDKWWEKYAEETIMLRHGENLPGHPSLRVKKFRKYKVYDIYPSLDGITFHLISLDDGFPVPCVINSEVELLEKFIALEELEVYNIMEC